MKKIMNNTQKGRLKSIITKASKFNFIQIKKVFESENIRKDVQIASEQMFPIQTFIMKKSMNKIGERIFEYKDKSSFKV